MSDYTLGSTIYHAFTTRAFATGVPTVLAGSPTLEIYENDSTSPIVEGASKLVLTISLNSIAGFNLATITATGGNGFESGKEYHIIIKTGTVGGTSVVGEVVGHFSIEKATADVVKWLGTAAATPATAGIPDVNVKNIDNDAASASGTVTFPNATLASTTNITAGTITTTTNLTNERSKYMLGAVWIDSVNGAAGSTSYTHGIVTNPCTTIADGKSIADNLKLKNFMSLAGSTLTLAAGMGGYIFGGDLWTLVPASQSLAGAHIDGATMTGTVTGAASEWDKCHIQTTTMPTATLRGCGLSGTFTVSATGIYTFDQCYSEVAAGGDWILDFGAAVGATTIGLRHWAGTVDVRNMLAGDVLVVAGTGKLTINANCTAGAIQIRGLIELVNNGSGQTITDTSRYSEDQNVTNVTGAAANLTTNNDKTGYALTATTGLGNQTANITGNLSGSVGSVTGAVGSVTGAVGSVTGAVGSVTGNVGGLVAGTVAGVTPATAAQVAAVLTTQITESYRANAAAPTLAQFMSEVLAHLGEVAISGTTKTILKLDHVTSAATYTLDSATTPAAITRAT